MVKNPYTMITLLIESVPNAETIFTNGGCFHLYLILKEVFEQAVPYYDPIEGHVYTKIGNLYFDINGSYKEISNKAYDLRTEPRVFKEAHFWVNTIKGN